MAPDGTLIAHGDPDRKALIAQSHDLSDHPLVADPSDAPGSLEYEAANGERQLAVAAGIVPLGWTVVIEQPTSEAYASAMALRRQLAAAVAIALVVTIIVGRLFGRRLIAPLLTLKRATQAVADGDLETRVDIGTGDEFADLGHAFNRMADRLVSLQEDVRRQERQAMFGRIAAGLFHDLSHPLQNIANGTQLLMRGGVDAGEWAAFHGTIQHELSTLKRFMEDLRNVTRPTPVERYAVDLNAVVGEIVDAMRPEGEGAGVTVEARLVSGALVTEGDRFMLGRVYRNLISNAIQATPPGGHVSIATGRTGGRVWTTVADTGSGIPAERLPRIFDDFVTTKRCGLGLGLAISKRLVEQLDGSITGESEIGRGSAFTLSLPARDERSNEAVAG
jgi:signal transduction histidine kinase